jgi:hypothetical protein
MLAPLDRINVVVGPNNSGKSNFLSVFRRLGPVMRDSLVGAGRVDYIEFADLHQAGDEDPPPVLVVWPLNVELIGHAPAGLDVLLSEELFRRGTSWPWLPFTTVGVGSEFAIDPLWIEQGFQTVPQSTWSRFSTELTSTQGGQRLGNISRVVESLKRGLMPFPEVAFIPAHRKVSGGDNWDLSGAGLVDRLDELKNAGATQKAEKRAYATIRREMAALLEVSSCDYNVPRQGERVLELIVDGAHRRLGDFGTGYEHALLMIAATSAFPDHLVVIEEPEVHLHPRLQRRLAAHLASNTRGQIILSTHSAAIIDAASGRIFETRMLDSRTVVREPVDTATVELLDELGYRASDILQANCIIWVEGPSDRVLVNEWIRLASKRPLTEGIHYSIMFYGGSLLDRLSAQAEGEEDRGAIPLRRLQQHFAIVADSDRRAAADELKARVTRAEAQADTNSSALMWITAGRTIENYVAPELLQAAVREVHPSVDHLDFTGEEFEDALRAIKSDGTPLASIDKVALAQAAVVRGLSLDVLDLSERLTELIAFIETANA